MSNSRLLWPTPEQLRRRLDLMDRMMRKRGVDVYARRLALMAAWPSLRLAPNVVIASMKKRAAAG